MERVGLYAGSFDPVTYGHLWVIAEASEKYDLVYVAVGHNSEKQGRFTVDERLKFLVAVCDRFPNVKVTSFSGMYQADFAEVIGANYIIQGSRNAEDYTYLTNTISLSHGINQRLKFEILTPPDSVIQHISSSAVMGLLGFTGWEEIVEKMVPTPVYKALIERQKKADILKLESVFGGGSCMIKEAAVKRILEGYSVNSRKYHGINHLLTCYNEFLRCRHLLSKPKHMLAAILLHDSIYDPTKNNNEELSSLVSLDRSLYEFPSFLQSEDFQYISRAIFATKHTDASEIGDYNYLMDIDLAALGYSKRIFLFNNSLIRKEFSMVPDDVYHRNRKRFMLDLVNRHGGIFRTNLFKSLYEENARENILKVYKTEE
jgi:pantetheine-phosphate adenylyltransferase